jgi:formate hydrogenlyase subunit 3/multisubunit Na+/H+ antiporter MnhD subunit
MRGFLVLFLVWAPILAAFAVFPLRNRDRALRDRFLRLVPAVQLAAALLCALWPGAAALPGVCGLGLRFAAGGFPSLMAVLTAFLWMATALTSRDYFAGSGRVSRFYLFWLLTLGALTGVFLAADLFTLFVFFEVMSFTSYVWVAQNETPEALRAAQTYLAIAVGGGMALLAGVLMLQHLLGTLELAALPAAAAAVPGERQGELLSAAFLCLAGFGAKAGMFPLHIWLPRAHPVAPAPASALLSGILTKSGVFGVLLLSRLVVWDQGAWNGALLALGTVTMFLGAVLALFSVDFKRILACSSMSQIGFILVGAAMQGFLDGHASPAAAGTVLHMLNHSLIKLVLFSAAGVVYAGCHSMKLDDIRGWGRGKHWLQIPFFLAAASLCGIPGTSGYISKTLLHESLSEYIHLLLAAGAPAGAFRAAEVLFLLSGGLTAAYMTKLAAALFVARRPSGQRPSAREYMGRGTQTALAAGTAVLAALGLAPHALMDPLAAWCAPFLRAEAVSGVRYFSLANLRGAGISLAAGAAIYLLIVRTALQRRENGGIVYPDRWPRRLDLEESVYRPALRALSFIGALCARSVASAGELVVLAGEKVLFSRAPGVFVPKRAENFGVYGNKPRRRLVMETFSFDLLVGGIGLAAALVYIVLS